MIPLSVQTAGRFDVPDEVKQRYLTLATTQLEAIIACHPRNARYYQFAGSFYLRSAGQLDLAIERLEKARELSPTKQTILFELARAYLKAGRQAEGLELFREIYELAPTYDDALLLYSFGLIDSGQITEAEELLRERFGTVVPDDGRLLNLYVEKKMFDRVLSIWQKRVEQTPDNPDLRGSLGLAYFYNKQPTAAIAEFNKAAELNPAYKEAVAKAISDVRVGRIPQ